MSNCCWYTVGPRSKYVEVKNGRVLKAGSSGIFRKLDSLTLYEENLKVYCKYPNCSWHSISLMAQLLIWMNMLKSTTVQQRTTFLYLIPMLIITSGSSFRFVEKRYLQEYVSINFILKNQKICEIIRSTKNRNTAEIDRGMLYHGPRSDHGIKIWSNVGQH